MNNSTGFLFGNHATLAPDGDASRISTNIPTYTYSPKDYFAPVKTGILYEGAQNVLQGGYSSFFVPEAQTPLEHTNPYFRSDEKHTRCLENCTMGGCDDPTSSVHKACTLAGCCAHEPLPPQYEAPATLNSQRPYAGTNCVPQEFCKSQLDYYNCHPWSTLTPADDLICAQYGFRYDRNNIPWA